jgi:hypothetical protein
MIPFSVIIKENDQIRIEWKLPIAILISLSYKTMENKSHLDLQFMNFTLKILNSGMKLNHCWKMWSLLLILLIRNIHQRLIACCFVIYCCIYAQDDFDQQSSIGSYFVIFTCNDTKKVSFKKINPNTYYYYLKLIFINMEKWNMCT